MGCPLCCRKGDADLETKVYSMGVSAFTARRFAYFASTGFGAANIAAKSAGIGQRLHDAVLRLETWLRAGRLSLPRKLAWRFKAGACRKVRAAGGNGDGGRMRLENKY